MSLADHLAQTTGTLMLTRDPMMHTMGMQLIDIAPGSARVSMRVHENMTNALGLCAGSAMSALAESCFLLAANSHNQRAVTHSASIQHILPAKAGETLLAMASEVSRTSRSGFYHVEIRNESGALVADFQAQARFVRGTWVQAFAP